MGSRKEGETLKRQRQNATTKVRKIRVLSFFILILLANLSKVNE